MDTPPRRSAHHSTHRLALLVTGAVGTAIAVALWAAIWTPGRLDLASALRPAGQPVVTWVAPDGPAWSAGVRPGDIILSPPAPARGGPSALVARADGYGQLLHLSIGPPTPLQLLGAGLGLCLLVLGVTVLTKSPDRMAGRAFWRMSLCGGAALGFVPAGLHGTPWALVLQFTALRLLGPTLLELAAAFPSRRSGPERSPRVRPLLRTQAYGRGLPPAG